jgi:hypothetical protein
MIMATDKRKRAIRVRMAQTGEPYAVAARHIDAHRHPRPDLAGLGGLPYAAGRAADMDLAAAMVGACRAGCRPCQEELVSRLLAADCATIAVLAGAVYGTLPAGAGVLASPATHAWQPLAHHANASGDGAGALAALEAMTSHDREALLQDALDHWAAGGLPADALHLLHLDLDEVDDPGPETTGPIYALSPGTVETPGGPLPMVVLVPETPAAGLDDIHRRCGWPAWDMTILPEADPSWRMRMEIATRSIAEIVHVDGEGWDDVLLWQAPEPVSLPQQWWDLVDRVQQVLLCGPAADPSHGALQAAAAGELPAVIARVRFL